MKTYCQFCEPILSAYQHFGRGALEWKESGLYLLQYESKMFELNEQTCKRCHVGCGFFIEIKKKEKKYK